MSSEFNNVLNMCHIVYFLTGFTISSLLHLCLRQCFVNNGVRDLNGLYVSNNKRGAFNSTGKFFPILNFLTSNLGQKEVGRKIILIYAWQCCKNHNESASTTTLGLFLGILKVSFYFSTSTHSSPLPRAAF